MRKITWIIGLLLMNLSMVQGQGFLRADGTKIIDSNGNNFIIRSLGTGNWMIQEGYMMKSSDAGLNTQWQFREKLAETVGEAKTDSFYNTWLANHFTKADMDSMKAWGFNALRPALHYKWFTLPIEDEVNGSNTWLEKGFVMLDSLVLWATQNQMYLFFDMHGTPGGQGKNKDISDYNPSKPSLWESEANKTKLTALWYKIAERYKNEPYVGGYDLINETNWDFENSGNENGVNCKLNIPLLEMHKRLIDTIRIIDKNHMVFVSGNSWGNNYNGMNSLAQHDNNLAYTFHKYWNLNDQGSVQWIIDKANELNVPIWMSESGENSNTWFTNAISLFENNNIGWSWWPEKKGDINSVLEVRVNEDYSNLLKFWQSGTPAMNEDQAFNAVMKWADNHKIENCYIHYGVIDAMFRQINSNETKPSKHLSLAKPIFFTDYDYGRNNFAYFDTDTSNHNSSTGTYTSWNAGWSYRNDGVDIEACKDAELNNGFNIGWTADGEWLQYSLEVDSVAAYTLNIRHASGASGSKFHFEVNGINITGPLSLPATSGWADWNTATFENIIVPAGAIKLRFVFDQGGSNLNYFKFANPKSIDEVDFICNQAKTSSDGSIIYLDLNKQVSTKIEDINLNDFELLVDLEPTIIKSIEMQVSSTVLLLHHNAKLYSGNTVSISYNGTSVKAGNQNLTPFDKMLVLMKLPYTHEVPGKIQAEDFIENNGLNLESCEDTGGGKNTAYTNPGDYLVYRVHVNESSLYKVDYRVATERSDAVIHLQISEDGETYRSIDTVKFTSTSGWQSWQTQSSRVTLEEGYYFVKIYIKQGEHNLNWFELSKTTPNSINQNSVGNVSIYPNPAKDFMIIKNMNGPLGNVSIFNLTGQLVATYYSISSEINANISHLEKGIYLLNIINAKGTTTQKFVVE